MHATIEEHPVDPWDDGIIHGTSHGMTHGMSHGTRGIPLGDVPWDGPWDSPWDMPLDFPWGTWDYQSDARWVTHMTSQG